MLGLQTSILLPFGNGTAEVTYQTSDLLEEVSSFTLEHHHLEFSFPISR